MSFFLKIDGVTGESSDAGHQGWIDIESFRWGSERFITSNTSTRGDRESSNAVITDLHITKLMDSASPTLFIDSCCARGRDMTLHLTKTGAGSGADVFMEYTLKHAIISSYDVSAKANDTGRPMEFITISFVELEVKYTPYDEDGNAQAGIAVGFDTATNMKK